MNVPAPIVPAVCNFPRNLSFGDTGADVSDLQTFLELKGFLVMPEGVLKGTFGGITKAAVIAHQRVVQVPTTGYFGPMTRTASCVTPTQVVIPISSTPLLSTATYARDLFYRMEGDDVRSLQTFLESKGFLVIPTGSQKGFFGNYTQVALIKYQASVNLPATGYFGPLTQAAVQGRN